MSIWTYFDVLISNGTKARFKRHKITRQLYVFQFNCAEDGLNVWNEPGYGYGHWMYVK